ncbi:microsomal signal peptidase subunit [Cavenderia fasciculata]|uniref:Signal peptidase complex subunit 2 n=1 Tax=Cavenderia fasciculata TaxID=261658 RepID=F4PJT7_CACFS|nr:microsomal signal peptidase subunit [Cavenderia fasciculata]EGG23861.1 microsomal signal peptidase subunit [Cavenderia fasciculata]|eukprot:XP_004361712.1 microsomal signal peptidase subunit [Cavenderia fasciculata]
MSTRKSKSTPATDQPSQPPKEYPEVKVQLYDGLSMKQALDDSIVRYFTDDLQFSQNHTLNILKVLLGFVGCILAGLAQFYPTPFPKNKPILITCVLLYGLISFALYYITMFIQKDSILNASKDKTNLQISTILPRYDPNYTVKMEVGNYIHSMTHSIDRYFDSTGILDQPAFFHDILKLYNAVTSKQN